MLLGFDWKRRWIALGMIGAACCVWLALAGIAGSHVANANPDTDFTYHPVADGIEITDYAGPDTEVVIPDTLGGLPVTSIGYAAFQNKGLTKVTLNEGLLRIDNFAFSWNNLTEIKIPSGVTSLGNSTFMENELTAVDIPASVKTIGPYAFYENNINKVMLNEGLETIQEAAFIDNPITKIIIPSTVTTIEGSAFQNTDLAFAVIPQSVTTMSTTVFDLVSRPDFTIVGWVGSKAYDHANLRGIPFTDITTLPVPDIQFAPDSKDWAQTAATTVTGATYEHYNLRYAWSNTTTPPDLGTAWSPLAIGDEIEQPAEGEWYLHVYASPLDPADRWHSGRFRVDRTPPTLSVAMTTDPSGDPYMNDTWSTEPVNVNVTASDPFGDIRHIMVEIDGVAAYAVPSDTHARTFNANGTYQLKLTAVDQAGNVSATELRTVKINGSNPPSSSTGSEQSGNARLKELIVSDGELNPAFSGDVTQYTLRLVPEIRSITITLLPELAQASTSLNGQTLGSGSVKADVSLEPDIRQLEIAVTAEDGTKRTYKVALEREDEDQEPAETPEAEEPCSARAAFDDIAGHWGEPFIIEAGCQGIVQGYPDGSFKPDRLVTRAEFTVMLAGLFPGEGAQTALAFSDLAGKEHWAGQAIAQAAAAGIVSGYPDGAFRPEATITRAEMAVMIAKALGLPTDANLSTDFADDAEIPAWAKSAITSIHRLGIVIGRGGNRFVPIGAATRAEAAAMLLRTAENRE